MSDSDSGPEFVDYDDIRHGGKFTKDSPFVALQPPDDKCERWNKIPVILKKKAAQLMHVSAFWYHILLCRENHNTTRWAVQVGFLDSNVSNDLSLKRLHRIEILEAILRAMEKGCLLEDQTRHMIWISNTFNLMLFPPQAHQQLPRHLLHMRVHPGMPSALPASAMAQSVALSPGSANDTSGHFTRPPQQNQAPGPQAPQPNNVCERIMDRLSVMFPHYSRLVLYKFTGEMRTANGGCLTSLSYEEVINRVAQHILDHQDNTREQLSSAGEGDPGAQPYGTPSHSDSPASVCSTGTPPPAHVWKRVGAHRHSQSKALNMEDPCIICHEDMSQEDLCVLECRHSFHRECIKSWLKEQSTCPTCREHALLPEDFPLLLGRIRRGHTSAFS
ncbi:uncharacterized protein ACWYII_002081 isoform 2-T5 [Salvelinus alpinus]